MLRPVILSGGAGSRLWPASRRAYPKQFLPLLSDRSLIQETLLRVEGLDVAAPMIVCNKEHRFIVAEQMRILGIAPDRILLEPEGRNTAPALAVAALAALAEDEEAVLLVLPADHIIRDVAAFRDAIKVSAEVASQEGRLVTFGVVPTAPETGYGYLKKGRALGAPRLCDVEAFIEKPDPAKAASFLQSHEYLWNSGMFVFRAKDYLEELQTFEPEVAEQSRLALAQGSVEQTFTWIADEPFRASPSISIDYAVMERTSKACLVELDVGWSDVGSWDALWRESDRDGDGNAVRGDVLALDSKDCFVSSERSLIATIGLEGVIIVESDDAILVANKNRSQDVKEIVTALDAQNSSKHQMHRKVYRPWGSYDSIDQGERFQVKRITVKPGQKLSLQLHHHRAEHWIVVAGTARVVCGDQQIILRTNESTFIPMGVKHRLENPGKIDLEIIEVQSGSYLGEDDIVRLDDVYGRA